MKILRTAIVITFLFYVINLNAQTWVASEQSHFGIDGFGTINSDLLTSQQLETAYVWEASDLQSANICWNRTLSPSGGQFKWESIENTQGTYNWSKSDAFVKTAQQYNINLLVLVHPFVHWDQPSKRDIDYDKPNDMTAFKKFIAKMVERYDNDGIDDMPGLLYPIKYYEIGNEPEGPTFGDSPDTYNDFMTTLKAARDTAKVVYPDVKILIGGAAPIYDFQGAVSNNLDTFWKGALNRANVADYFDIFNFHYFVGQYTADISDYVSYWDQLLSTYGLSEKEIWLTETGSYSGTATFYDGSVWPSQTTEYQASWWIKHSSYSLANGVSKLFDMYYYSDQTGWANAVSFVEIDKTTKKAIYYAQKLIAEKIDVYSSVVQNAYASSGQNKTSGNFKFMVNEKPIYILWNDQGGNATLTGLNSGRVKITSAVPTLDSNGDVILDGSGNPTFQTTEANVTGGQVAVTLSTVPVYVEEIISAPSAPILASPFNGTTGIDMNPSLSWNTATGISSYRLQIAKDSLFVIIVYDDSTITSTSKQVTLENGTKYYWRVNAKNEGGTSVYSSTWSFTTIISAPNTPNLLSPADETTNISTLTTFIWSSAVDASFYRLQVSKDSTFTSTVFDDSTITSNSKQVMLENGTKYYWRVNAKNEGGTSVYSSTWSFTTIISAPNTPTLVTPVNKAIGISKGTTLVWDSSLGANTYRLQIAKDSLFVIIVYDDSTITSTSKQVMLENGTKYFWRVNAKNEGGTSVFSSVWSFTTIISAPNTPNLLSPADETTNISTLTTFIWSAAIDASFYRLQVSQDSTFTSTVFDDSTITGTSRQVQLMNNTNYFWRILAKNIGGLSSWSDVYSFTTLIAMPITPALVYPSNNQNNLSIELNFIWNKVNNTDTYSCQIASDSNFSQIVFNDTTVVDTTKQITLTTHGKKYYWRTRAKNSGGISLWSDIWNFITILPSPTELTAIPGILNSIKLIWKDRSNGEVGFIFERKQDNSNYTVIDTIQSNDTAYVDTDVEKDQIYYYKIKSFSHDCESDYSNEASAILTNINIVELPKEYSLSQNFPNPFNPATIIKYSIPKAGFVTLKIYDALGKEIQALENSFKLPGQYETIFNGADLSSGIYFYRIQSDEFTQTKKLILLK